MRVFSILAAALIVLSGCATTSTKLDAVMISRIGIINNLPENAGDVYIGVTVFENEVDQRSVGWSFPEAVMDELRQSVAEHGVEVVDLSGEPDVEARRNDWFELGYSLDLGLAKHRFDDEAQRVLSRLMAEMNLDVVLFLRQADYNEDVPYGEAHPIGAFGAFERPRLFSANALYTFVQIEARVVAGSPPAVLGDLNGSNLVEIDQQERPMNLRSEGFEQRMSDQIKQAVSRIVDDLGV